ncbi:MAG: PIG-L deacetylase family protein [Armatimonadota bacterium]
MEFKNQNAEIYIPDGKPLHEALTRTTHMGIGAHQDDLEIMTFQGILECFGVANKWYAGVVVTDGAGSPRAGLYANYTDDEMKSIRRTEQIKAAFVGEYSVQAMLNYTSSQVKDSGNHDTVEEIKRLISACKPSVIYTHNLADKHDTHVSVVLRVIQAVRELPEEIRPEKMYGCEAWRDLDWLLDTDKVLFDVAEHENIAAATAGVFDSQISGGKRYDLASMARRRANATYLSSHSTDTTSALAFAMDLTPLVKDADLDPSAYVSEYVERFAVDVKDRISRLSK